MIEFIFALVANGSYYGPQSYAPYLPFCNFIPLILLGALGLGLFVSLRFAVQFVGVSALAIVPTYYTHSLFWLSPEGVFYSWVFYVGVGLLAFNFVRRMWRYDPHD